MLIQYFVYDLDVAHPGKIGYHLGAIIAWVIAAPRLAGLFRLLAPLLIDFCRSRKWFCVGGYILSSLIAGLIPITVPMLMIRLNSVSLAIFLLVVIWCVYHLVEYLATAAFLSWMGDLVSQKIRGRFFAVRERWMLLGQILGATSAAVIMEYERSFDKLFFQHWPKQSTWQLYLIPAIMGSVFLLSSAFFLAKIPEIAWKRTAFDWKKRIQQAFAPFSHGRFMLFVAFGCWIQMANGLTQTTQSEYNWLLFPTQFFMVLIFMNVTRLGQLILSPTIGRLMDRLGNIPVMVVSMIIVSTGSLFYFFATLNMAFLIAGAWIVWIFWVGVNIGQAALALSLAPKEQKTSFVAFYYAVTTAALALATLAGGMIADHCRTTGFFIPLLGWNYTRFSFVLSWFLRLVSVVFLLLVVRPVRIRSEHD
ncbi:MAG: hypothetical protein FWC50_11315 [Planctomycetaceae bacterium]|nr:hypothetical protein [Planctomycetaceae bacterium]